jgi:hypothetical protein
VGYLRDSSRTYDTWRQIPHAHVMDLTLPPFSPQGLGREEFHTIGQGSIPISFTQHLKVVAHVDKHYIHMF